MNNMNEEQKVQELAERIYDLDAEVYAQLGSSLGRVFNRDRVRCVNDLVKLLKTRDQGHVVRSELALISNMARTITDHDMRKLIMTEYNKILHEVAEIPTTFTSGDIVDEARAKLNELNLKNRFSDDDHLIICISRSYGCGGSEIGFDLADALKINFYDGEIFNAVLKRLEAGQDEVEDKAGYGYQKSRQGKGDQYVYKEVAFAPQKKTSLREMFHDFNRYHGLSKRDAVFFNQSDLICDMAKKEDFVVMGRCADMILANNNIPHISIYITAPFEQRVNRILNINGSTSEKKVRRILKNVDRAHMKYYEFYTGHRWGSAPSYDLCINSASYGIDGSVDLIRRMINR